MKISSWEEFLAGEMSRVRPSALSIGVFDGVHRGHEELVRHIREQEELFPWIISFDPNPSRVFNPSEFPGDLMSRKHKLEKLGHMGIEAGVIIDFSREFGRLGGAEFLARVCEGGNVRYLAVGEDFHCGRNMDTGAWSVKGLLEPWGVRVDIVPPVMLDGGVVSSTRIRTKILAGDFAGAEKLLGHAYTLDVENLPVRDEEGRALLDRDVLLQVVPREGSFTVCLKGPETKKNGILDIDRRYLSWNSSGIVHAITFTQNG